MIVSSRANFPLVILSLTPFVASQATIYSFSGSGTTVAAFTIGSRIVEVESGPTPSNQPLLEIVDGITYTLSPGVTSNQYTLYSPSDSIITTSSNDGSMPPHFGSLSTTYTPAQGVPSGIGGGGTAISPSAYTGTSATAVVMQTTTSASASSTPSSTASSSIMSTTTSSAAPLQTSSTSSSSTSSKSNHSNTPLIAAAAVLGVLLALALAGLIFMFIKRRKEHRKEYIRPSYSSPEAGVHVYSDKGNEKVEGLRAQLANANRQLATIQGSLLASGKQAITKDDNALSREYTQIGTEVSSWTGTYFKASNNSINLTKELYEFLTAHVPSYQELLASPVTRPLVVRAIVCQVLQESYQDNAFFGNTMSAIRPLIRQSSATPAALNSWRSETFFLVEKSPDFASQCRAAVTTITDRIESLTYPLASSKQSFQGDSSRYKYLEGIVHKASDFAVSLGKQRANFQVLNEPAGCEFAHATMDDVLQQTNVTVSAEGISSHPLEGQQIQATIFPLLMKYGSEAGEGYDQVTILSKAKVLV